MGFKLFSLITKLEEIFSKNIDGFEKIEIEENSEIDKGIILKSVWHVVKVYIIELKKKYKISLKQKKINK